MLPLHGARAEEEEPRTREEVRAYVKRCLENLGAASFDVREEARRGLETYGDQARDLLEAAKDDPDPEVRRTVRLLLERSGVRVAVPALPPEDLGAIGRVTLEATGPPAEVLARLGAPIGARFELPEGHPSASIAVKLADVPFFTALERITLLAGLGAPSAFDAAGSLALEPRTAEAPAPWCAAGPLRVRVAEVTSVRTLTPPSRRRYVLALDLHWIPSVQLVTYRLPKAVEARDAEGRPYHVGTGTRGNTTYGVGSSSRSARLNLRLEPEGEEGVERLATLSFTLTLRLRHDRREVVFDDLARLEPPVRGGEDQEVTLARVAPPEQENGPWIVDVVARLGGQAAQNSLSVVLDRADGSARVAATGSRFPSADGTLALSARAYGRWEEPPVAARVVWFRQEEEGELSFTLADVPLR